jgi:hypothetical protein
LGLLLILIIQIKAMRAIGCCWILGEEVEVPRVLYDVMRAINNQPPWLDDIAIVVSEDDPSAIRDVTDPIYYRCWWRGEGPVGAGDVYDRLATLYTVNELVLRALRSSLTCEAFLG